MREVVMRVPDDHPVLKPREIVRCKECKHFTKTADGYVFCIHEGGMLHPDANSFCSRGERKSNVDSHNSDWDR